MQLLPKPSRGVTTVCVGFDDETPALVAVALSLAKRTGTDLRFVNVVELPALDLMVADMPLYNVSSSLIYEAQLGLRDERERLMKALVEGLPTDVRASSALLHGDAVRAIIQDAEAHGAGLILTAANLDNYGRMIPQGFSVALRLMAEASMPVLVTTRTKPLKFDKTRFTMLIADDLQPSSTEAVRKAFELAAFLGECRVRHLHVHGDFRDLLHGSWLDIKERHPALRKYGESPEAVLVVENTARVKALNERAITERRAAEARGMQVEVDVRAGNVPKLLTEEIAEVNPDLVVFGRHRTLKARPYLIGRVNARTMLGGKHPVMVVPATEDLYARRAFPALAEK